MTSFSIKALLYIKQPPKSLYLSCQCLVYRPQAARPIRMVVLISEPGAFTLTSVPVQVASLVIHRMQASCLFRAFSAWAARCNDKEAARQRLTHAVAALRNRQLMRCWVSWLGLTDARLAGKGENTISCVALERPQCQQMLQAVEAAHDKHQGSALQC